MKIDIFGSEQEVALYHDLVNQICEDFFGVLNLKTDILIGFHFVDDERIKDLNCQHRQICTPTDVLSFPLWNSLDELPKEGSVNLGDVFVNLGHVEANAKNDNKELKEEFIHIIKHSLNHLIGKHH